MRSYSVGALPIINHLLDRMNLEPILQSYLPREDRRTKIPSGRGLMLLVRNILISREPLYGVGEWASRYAPDLLGLTPGQVSALNDDRSGRWLIRRGLLELAELREKLHGPRTRYRDPAKVHEAVAEIVKKHGLSELIRVAVQETPVETFRQNRRGRPGANTQYVKQVKSRFDLEYEIDHEKLQAAERMDGVFPLVTNDRTLTELELLHAYKRQPTIEKRFEQMKTDFAIAPVWLKDVKRVDALIGVYYLALLTEALLERELRKAMEREGLESLPMYPEGRACRKPTARRLLDLFDPIQRHEIHQPGKAPTVIVTELTPLQRRLLRLLRIPASSYGH